MSRRSAACPPVLLLAEGDRVSADAVLADGVNLSVGESALTGESVPVRKTAAPDKVTPGMGRLGGMRSVVFSARTLGETPEG